MEKWERVASKLDIRAPINIDELMEATATIGPLRIRRQGSHYEIDVAVYKCICATEDCQERVVAVWRRNGLLSRHWLISSEDLCSYENLSSFGYAVEFGDLSDPRGEVLLTEVRIFQEMGMPYSDVSEPICVCSSCAAEVGIDQLSNMSLLTQIAFELQDRDQIFSEAFELAGENGVEIAKRAFNAGYSAARNIDELSIKENLERSALQGNAVVAAARAGGEARAAAAKHNREAILSEMARLIGEGKSVSSAALIAANRGIGTSQDANRKAWNRHKSGT